ncbi:MAG TPA: hypothetical protein VEH57_05145 [Thermoplasmata archaeon]|nr:hypothetical protein [Thermoplasmata archaeon]HYB78584.1 hypothetical protein [Thermoplasmata archaeon]
MDSLDARLLRAMFPRGIMALSGVDPRRSVVELAQEVRSSRLTVRRRLLRWRSDGFWARTVAFPNPDLFGRTFYFQGFGVDGARSLTAFEHAASRSPHVALIFQVQALYGVLVAVASPEECESLVKTMRQVPGVRETAPPVPVRFPSSRAPMRRTDWKIVAGFRRHSPVDWRRVAADAGITTRGLRRRVSQLIEANQIFFFPELDFRRSEGPVAQAILLLEPGASEPDVRKLMVARFPDHIPMENIFPLQTMAPPSLQGPYRAGGSAPSDLGVAAAYSCFIPVRSSAEGDDLHRTLSAIPGVYEPLIMFPVHNFEAVGFFDARIAEMLESCEFPVPKPLLARQRTGSRVRRGAPASRSTRSPVRGRGRRDTAR